MYVQRARLAIDYHAVGSAPTVYQAEVDIDR